MSFRKAILTILLLLCAFSSVWAVGEVDFVPRGLPLQLPTMRAPDEACVMFHHWDEDSVLGYSSGYDSCQQTVVYYDPATCGAPVYPFEIAEFSFVLLDPNDLFDNRTYKWPVTIDVVVYDLAVGDSCAGPGDELCRVSVVCDSAAFAWPEVGTVTFPDPCCVDQPFYIGIEYKDTVSVRLPSVIFNYELMPDTCSTYQYYCDDWYEWSDFWMTPPGNPFFWVNGQTVSLSCCPDADADSVCLAYDNCPDVANQDQADIDGDGVGDMCDNCPDAINAGQSDADGDGVGDMCDNCPDAINAGQSDGDADGIGDDCDNCPAVSNVGQVDTDGDGLGDACDPDDDNDGISDGADNCPLLYNPGQEDGDSDGVGDACGCIGPTGNINCDLIDLVDIADLTRLIDYLFISMGPLGCPDEGNVDGDPGGVIDIGDLTALIDYLFITYALPEPCR